MSENHNDSGYNITITGRHVHVTEAMKDYAIEKLSKLERFSPNNIIDIHVTMDIQKLEHRTTAVMQFSHYKIQVQASTEDMYKSVDKAVTRLETKLRKYKIKLQKHNHQALPVVDMKVNVLKPLTDVEAINEEIDEANRIQMEKTFLTRNVVSTENRPLKTLTTEYALMKIELSDDRFMVFRDEADRKLKVIYQRDDTNYGIICPE